MEIEEIILAEVGFDASSFELPSPRQSFDELDNQSEVIVFLA